MSLEKIINGMKKTLAVGGLAVALTFAGAREARADLPEIPVCTHPFNQVDADISKDSRIVVWTDRTKDDDWDIYGCEIDPNTRFILREFPICTAPGNQQNPAVSGNGDIVVWRDRRNSIQIYGYKISENREFLIATSSFTFDLRPSISENGDIVVWENGYYDGYIYASRIDTNTCEVIEQFPICVKPDTRQGHSISENGDIVVWRDNRNDNADIYGYKISKKKEFPICTNFSSQENPSISGNIVVWEDCRNSNDCMYSRSPKKDIYGCEIDPNTCKVIREFPICIDRGTQRIPNIYGNMVVWQGDKNRVMFPDVIISGNIEGIYGYDINLRKQFEICTDPYTYKTRPKASIDTVIWSDNRGGYLTGYRNYDIYMARIPKPENIIFSLDPDLNNDSIVNLKDLAILSWHWLGER